MKKVWSIILVLVLIAVCGVFIFRKSKKNKELRSQGIVATSKKGDVTDADIEKYLSDLKKNFGQTLNFEELKAEEKKLVIGDILNNRIILEKARENKVASTEEYKKRLAIAKDNLLKEIYLQDLVARNVFEGDIKARYDDIVKAMDGKKEFLVSHILVEKEADIKKVIEELKTKKFAEVASKYSIDSTKSNGGAMGWVLEGQTAKEFDEMLKQISLGVISKPFKTQFGWHVILVTDKRDAHAPEFNDETKEAIKAALSKEYIRKISTENINAADIQLVVK